jgi:alginate O-acetyltransferase complex protein AlgI
MLFNSYEFIFAFLPITLAGFFTLGTISRPWALRWIIFVSIFFYAWWRPLNVLIIAPSILINFAFARTLRQLGEDKKSAQTSKLLLVLGIAFNVLFLGYFKYIDFGRSAINDLFGTNLVLTHVILPLGISFITFQKIAFLVDVHAKKIKSFTFQDYCLFVLFFPQLIAGPIVHYREMMPQFQNASCRFNKENVAVGLTLLSFGLFKKVVLADQIATFVTPIYERAVAGGQISLVLAWVAAIGFTLQIYFDFSGYTDMALGIARFFGIRLPQNFNSPLQASSIIDFWLRWHMTLTRFLTAYVYNPLVLWLTRSRMSKGLPGLTGRGTTIGAFATLLMFPLLLTMFISGLWHGAGYGFIVWGLLHGVYLTINHAWRFVVPRLWQARRQYAHIMRPLGQLLTFVSVTLSMVFFRSPTIASAIDILQGMIGQHGVSLQQTTFDRLGSFGHWLHKIGVTSVGPELWVDQGLEKMMPWILGSLLIALALPNTLEILDRYEPALGVKPSKIGSAVRGMLKWDMSITWSVAVAILVVIGVLSLAGPSEFLYWQF